MSSEGKPGVPSHIPSLDGLRGIAVMLVVVAHAGYAFMSGALGVNIFFFLSGFLITTLLRRELEVTHGISFKKFYLRRVLRIFPMMYLVLTAATVLMAVGVLHSSVSRGVIAAQFLHLTNYMHVTGHPVLRGTVVMWSLSVEEHFYLLFPALFLFLMTTCSPRRRLVVMLGICISVLIWRIVIVKTGILGGEAWAYEASDGRIDSILWGCILAMFANPYFEPRAADRFDKPWLGALAVALVIASQGYKAHWFSHTVRYTLQCLCFVPMFVLALRRPTAPIIRWLQNPILVWIGVVSYALYLVHFLVVEVLRQQTILKGVPLLAVTLAISLPICALTMRFIEKPAARLRKRLGGV